MAIVSMPAGLNSRPLQDGYTFEPHEPLLRTDMEQGPARQRRLFANSPSVIQPVWPWSFDEFEVFRAWYHKDLHDGQDWFWAKVFIGGREQLGLCRFAEAYQPSLVKIEWHVTAKIEVRNVEYMDDESRWFAGHYGPAVASAIATSLHRIVHEEAPQLLPA